MLPIAPALYFGTLYANGHFKRQSRISSVVQHTASPFFSLTTVEYIE